MKEVKVLVKEVMYFVKELKKVVKELPISVKEGQAKSGGFVFRLADFFHRHQLHMVSPPYIICELCVCL